jgi:hypothetical protein
LKRRRFGADAADWHPSMEVALICDVWMTGLVRFSGPGAPSVGVLEPTAAVVVETTMKSVALSFPSCGVPVVRIRRKLYCAVIAPAPAPGRFVPSLSRSQFALVLAGVKPTASKRFAVETFAGLAVEKTATFLSASMLGEAGVALSCALPVAVVATVPLLPDG